MDRPSGHSGQERNSNGIIDQFHKYESSKSALKNNSTRSNNQNTNIIYSTNVNLKHTRQKSTSNLNEFVIRKLSVNELPVQRQIFDSRKTSTDHPVFLSDKKNSMPSKSTTMRGNSSSNLVKYGEHGFHSHKPSALFDQTTKNAIGKLFEANALELTFSPVKEFSKGAKNTKIMTTAHVGFADGLLSKKPSTVALELDNMNEDLSKKDSKRYTSSTKNLNFMKSKPRHQKSYSNNMGLNLVSHRSSEKYEPTVTSNNFRGTSSIGGNKLDLLYLNSNKISSDIEANF